MRLPLTLQFYKSKAVSLASQRLVNFYMEPQPKDARSPVALFPTPGLTLFKTVGLGPIRKQCMFNGALVVVSGSEVYSVLPSIDPIKIGDVTQTGRVEMVSNGVQLFILSGSDGFVTDGVTVAPVTDPDWPGATSVTYLDGFFVYPRPASGQFFICTLYDGTSFDALDFATSESNPDRLLRSIAYGQRLWNFGAETIEIAYNSGQDFPFIRQSVIERGCIHGGTIAESVNGLIWVGDDRVVYITQSTAPQRISDFAIEQALSQMPIAEFNNCDSWVYEQEGHSFYVLRVAGVTFVCDISVGKPTWHERESYRGLPWKVGMGVAAFDMVIVGEYEGNKLYVLDPKATSDNGAVVERYFVQPVIHAEGASLDMASLQLECEVGVGELTGDSVDPQIMMQFSDDGGHTYGNEHWRSLGKVGEFAKRVIWRRLGSFDQRVLKISVSAKVRLAIYALSAEVQPSNRAVN